MKNIYTPLYADDLIIITEDKEDMTYMTKNQERVQQNRTRVEFSDNTIHGL